MQQKYAKVVGGSGDTTQGATATYQDNLYLAINGEWLKTAKIPADKTSTGGFSDLALNIEKTLMQDFADFAAGNKVPANDLLATAVKFYQVAADFKRRNQEGFKPAQAGYESIKNLTNFQSWHQQLPKWLQQGYPLPFNLGIDADMKDTSKNVVYAAAPGLILPDTTYYHDNDS
ncbi:MAG: M13 family peptidase, partial [Bombilactobacillus sp.]